MCRMSIAILLVVTALGSASSSWLGSMQGTILARCDTENEGRSMVQPRAVPAIW